MYIYIYIHTHTHIHTHTYIFVYTSACAYNRRCICAYLHMDSSTHVHVHEPIHTVIIDTLDASIHVACTRLQVAHACSFCYMSILSLVYPVTCLALLSAMWLYNHLYGMSA